MKRILFAVSCLALAQVAFGGAKTYQVTGPVLDVKGSTIVVENKDKEKWEIETGADTKTKGAVKKGDKVTIQYQMKATSVEVKPAK
ncbi:MAG: hypothetical protein OEW08_02025 [Gammaproteobacteria bacterium]|nr:hypothetical protein [Gammaproteobacteria bacterium]